MLVLGGAYVYVLQTVHPFRRFACVEYIRDISLFRSVPDIGQ